jgi:predicted Zn-dependent protease
MKRIAIALCCLLVLTAVSAQAGMFDKVAKVAETGKKLNVKIDEKQERSLGRGVAANLIARFGLVEDKKLTDYVATLGNYVASLSDRPELPFRFAILDADEVNAFACPGGYIFVTRGALAAAQDESELAAILAHEVIHVTERHGVKSIEDSYRKKVAMQEGMKVGASAAGVNPKLVAAFGELTDEITENLLTKGYSKKLEYESDKLAIGLLVATGYDPQALERFLSRLAEPEKKGALKTLKATHPKPSDRAKKANKAMKKLGAQPNPEARFEEQYAKMMA